MNLFRSKSLALPVMIALACQANMALAQFEPADVDSAEDATPNVTAIIVEGNQHTKTYVILREMKTAVGQPLDPELLAGDQKRILNLGLFERVEIEAAPAPAGVQIVVTVYEYWYLYPFPIFFVNDRDWGKLSYGAGLLHFNFRGRREVLSFSGWAGYNPSLQLDYSNPWMLGDTHLFGHLQIFTRKVQNRFLHDNDQDVDEKRLGANLSIGKRFGYFTFFSLHFGYSEIRFDPGTVLDAQGRNVVPTLDPSGRDRLPTLGATFLYDGRDLHEYPRAGTYVRLWGRRTGFGDRFIHYYRYGFDLRRYQKISRNLSLAMRSMADLSHDEVPVHDLVNFGFKYRVRGHFYRRLHGDNLAMGSVELRVPILPWRYYSLTDESMPSGGLGNAVGRLTQNLKFGISAGLFVDYGIIWNREDEFQLDTGRGGAGLGLHFHVPFLDVLRFEGAVNEDGRIEGFVDIGASF